MQLTDRFAAYEESIFTDLANLRAQLLAQGRPVIDLSIGSPDLPPPLHVRKALQEAVMDGDQYGYAVKDRPELLQAVAAFYHRRFGVSLDPEAQICSLLGSQEGLAHIAMALLDPGSLVLVPDPGYPIFEIGPALCGMELYRVPQIPAQDFLMDLEALPEAVKKRARLLVLSYPANPSTAMADVSYFKGVAAFARRWDILVLHDNAYAELTFDGTVAGSYLQAPGAVDTGIEFFSLSKTYNLAGARIAFAVGNPGMIRNLRMLKSHFDFGMFLPLQGAAVAALSGPQACVAQLRETYRRRRDVLIDGLAALGWQIPPSRATMFVWAPLPPGAGDSVSFARELALRSGVIAVPGAAFGTYGEGYLRLALVQDETTLARAVWQIGDSGLLARCEAAARQDSVKKQGCPE